MILKNAKILNDEFKFEFNDIKIKDGKISKIGKDIKDSEFIDLKGFTVIPGFIDTHIHGAYGSRFNDKDVNVDAITEFEATQGVTCIAATTATSEFNHLLEQFDNIVKAAQRGTKGAKVCGIHAEGPFINEANKGAMNPLYITKPSIEKLDKMIMYCKGMLKIITIAPEIENSKEVIEYAVKNGIKVSLGHTNATFDEANNAILLGAAQATHTFNAMRSFNHREPGVLGAVLLNNSVKCEMICDFVHLNPKTIELIYRIKGADNINMVSDSGHSAGMELSEFMVDGIMRYVKDGVVRLADGTIAGSTKTLLDGVKNLYNMGIPLSDISKMASLNPAKSLGIDNETGSIKEGKFADLAVLDDSLNIKYTLINGQIEYKGD